MGHWVQSRQAGTAGHGRLRLFLASSSVAALLIGSGTPVALAACLNGAGTGTGYTNPGGTTIAGICVTNTSFGGSVVNDGTINPSGINVENGTITGSIANNGVLEGGISLDSESRISAATTGIYVTGLFQGAISNAGIISVGNSGTFPVDIYVLGADFAGEIINSGTLSASFAGIWLRDLSSFSGGITNSGMIAAQASIYLSGVGQFGSSTAGGISNSGIISAGAGSGGINVFDVGTFLGGVSNSGTISGGYTGILISNTATFAGAINNSGAISGRHYGIAITATPNFGLSSAGGITNSGTISANEFGIWIIYGLNTPGNSFAGGISNSGTISANEKGIFIAGSFGTVSTFSGGITNSGRIGAGTGIVLGENLETFLGTIANSGTISGTGGTAIDVSDAHNAITINQTGGLISGAIRLSAHSDVLNVSGGTIAGDIVGSGSLDTVNFAPNRATIVYNNNFSGINQVNILPNNTSGFVFLNGNDSANSTLVREGGTLAGTGTITSSVIVFNGANLIPGTGLAGTNLSIVGNLTFFVGGGPIYIEGFNSTTASEAEVTGTALLNGAMVNVGPGSTVTAGVKYTILTDTAGGLGGSNTFYPTISYDGMIGTFSYDSDDVYLTFGGLGGCYEGPFPHANSGKTPGICVTNSSFTGNVGNTGTITSIGITVTNSTISGSIFDSGTLVGGISVDRTSQITATSGGAISVTGPTFSGGITNAGTLSAPDGTGILVSGVILFSGGITNSGLIDPKTGISVLNVSTFSGGIVNLSAGTINATATGIKVSAVSTFSGGITNAGAIFVGGNGISVTNISTYSGGISNGGIISVGGNGIQLYAVSTFQGGIINSGTISAGAAASAAVVVSSISTFVGGITNSGTISGRKGIAPFYISVFEGGISNAGVIDVTTKPGIAIGGANTSGPSPVLTFSGGINNSGTISSGGLGIQLLNDSIFNGGITNSGIIISGANAVTEFQVSISDGGVTNIGLISAQSHGIVIATGSTYSGGITNDGTISSGTNGIAAVTLSTFGGGITNSGTISSGGTGVVVSGVLTFTGNISNGGTISASERGITVNAVSTYSGNISNSGTISGTRGIFIVGSTINGTVVDTGTILASTRGIGIGAGTNGSANSSLVSTKTGIRVSGPTFTGGIFNGGTISAGARGIFVGTGSHASVTISTFSGGIINTGTIVAKTGIVVGSPIATFLGAISNSGNITGSGGTAIDLSAANNAMTINQSAGLIVGAIKLSANADLLNISGGTIAGNIIGSGSQDTINFNLGGGKVFTYGGAYDFSAINQLNVNSGLVILDSSSNSATNVNVASGATLEVGDQATPSAALTSTNPLLVSGMLEGYGTVIGGATIETGGNLKPGDAIGTLTIAGALTFDSGSTYTDELSPSQVSLTRVTGAPGTVSISIGAEVELTPHLGRYSASTVAIITSTGTLSGTFNPVITYTDSTQLNSTSLSYDANDVYLSYAATFVTLNIPSNATINEQNVGNAINTFILGGGTPPGPFQNLGNLSGPALLNALNALDGELATGAQSSIYQLMTQFLDLMSTQSTASGGRPGTGGGLGFAPDQQTSLPPEIASAYDSVLKAPPASFDQRWHTWGGAFGGNSLAQGNSIVGSSNLNTSAYGYAGGMDYHFAPDSNVGFALAGGGVNWGLAQGIGNGRSDAFMGGVYSRMHLGPAYLFGSLAFGNNWFATSRTALGDQLQARFEGQSFATRLEAGYRFSSAGVAPYAAVQTQWFHTPSYSETDLTGGGLGLSYNAITANDTRGELGTRFDDLSTLAGKPLILRGQLAWAHDWANTPALNAAFQSLPGSLFTVNGAPVPPNSALTSASAQWWFTPNWSFIAKFDGEFAPAGQTYSGSGTLRFTW